MSDEPFQPGEPHVDPRVYFAAQRTLLAWVRTGLALMGLGFVVARFGLFLHELEGMRVAHPPRPTGLSLWGGTVLIGIGVIVNILAAVEHVRHIQRLRCGETILPRPISLGVILSLLMALLGAGLAVYLVWVR